MDGVPQDRRRQKHADPGEHPGARYAVPPRRRRRVPFTRHQGGLVRGRELRALCSCARTQCRDEARSAPAFRQVVRRARRLAVLQPPDARRRCDPGGGLARAMGHCVHPRRRPRSASHRRPATHPLFAEAGRGDPDALDRHALLAREGRRALSEPLAPLVPGARPAALRREASAACLTDPDWGPGGRHRRRGGVPEGRHPARSLLARRALVCDRGRPFPGGNALAQHGHLGA